MSLWPSTRTCWSNPRADRRRESAERKAHVRGSPSDQRNMAISASVRVACWSASIRAKATRWPPLPRRGRDHRGREMPGCCGRRRWRQTTPQLRRWVDEASRSHNRFRSRPTPDDAAVEETNRRLLRARDAMDLTYGCALDIQHLHALRVLRIHFIREFVRRSGDSASLSPAPARRARALLLRCTDRSITDICFDVGFASSERSARHFTSSSASRRRNIAAGRGDHGATCFAWHGRDRAVLEKTSADDRIALGNINRDTQRNRRHAQQPSNLADLRARQDQAVDFYVGTLGWRSTPTRISFHALPHRQRAR